MTEKDTPSPLQNVGTGKQKRFMAKVHRGVAVGAVALLLGAGALTPAAQAHGGDSSSRGRTTGFVRADGGRLTLDGRPYEFAGTNNYYLGYKSTEMAEAVLDDARTAGFDVVRTWGFQDFQNPDGSDSVHSSFEGVWYQAWDADAGRPVVNTGPDGLERLDRVIAEARERGLRLVIPFTNNWNAFGGMDQYVQWAGQDTHADFYTDPTIRGWYKDWVRTLLERTNTVTGVRYKDDPTILAWELANEPRCTSAGAYPDGECDTVTITGWADEMSTFVKSVDRKHLLTAGDEGFFCRAEADWSLTQAHGPSGYGPGFGEDCADGVDTVALASLPNIDMMSLHLYPDHWKVSTDWGTSWIEEHAQAARTIGKPVYLGEFGLLDKQTRMPVYAEWLEAVRDSGTDGALYWILSSEQDDGTLYADYDGFTVYCPSPVCSLLTTHAGLVPRSRGGTPGPLADHDLVTTEAGTTVQVDLLANDVTFGQRLRPQTLDLQPARRGTQHDVTRDGVTARVVSPGKVEVSSTAETAGTVTLPYSVSDVRGRTTTANLVVTVQPPPGAPVLLASWETGTEGWAAASWQPDVATVSTTQEWSTDGASSLRAVVTGAGGWVGSPSLTEPLDLSTRRSIELDVRTGSTGTSVAVAVRSGDAWTWCQSPFEWVGAGTTTTTTIDLTTMGCDVAGLTDVHDVLVFLNAGTVDLDRMVLR